MNKFLFITCLTPDAYLTDLRKDLHQQYIQALLAQDNRNWTAFLLGERDKVEGNIHYIKCKGQTKEDKLTEAIDFLKALPEKPEFIVRLDDDDLISPNALNTVEKNKIKFDVFTDHYQYMFDSYSGKVLAKIYPWWPSTIIMKYEDALERPVGFDNKPLFTCPHDLVFHQYFKNRKVFYFEKDQPLYVRIFSPTSISFKMYDGNLDEEKYNSFIDTYGFWRYEMDVLSKSLREKYAALAKKHYKKTYKDISSLWNAPTYLRYQMTSLFRKITHKIRPSNS